MTHCHLRYLNPLPKELGDILKRFKKVLIPELNMGQLRTIIRAKYLVDAIGLNKVQGKPFSVAEVVEKIEALLRGDTNDSQATPEPIDSESTVEGRAGESGARRLMIETRINCDGSSISSSVCTSSLHLRSNIRTNQ